MSKAENDIAIVLIHGIGEQQPLDNLRSFVSNVILPLPETKNAPRYWSKPDSLSGSFDLRRFRARTKSFDPATGKELRHAPLDFYEYYWAHKMAGNSLGHTWQWLLNLLRRPRNVPAKLRGLWAIGWVLVIALVAATAAAAAWKPEGALALLAVAIVAGGKLAQNFALRDYLGDAARYFSPVPANIAVREEIRRGGVELLRKLHESGDYHRIIVVGHSLGSAIALDVLYHYWTLAHDQHGSPVAPQDEAIEALNARLAAGKEIPVDELRDMQLAVWRNLRDNGVPWRVTDLITLGSPLTHFPFLIGMSEADFAERKVQREIPCSPPVLDDGAVSFPITYPIAKGQKQTLQCLHHAALFAACRWTNIFFPHRGLVRGDPIGGPLAGKFGYGIKDMAVATRHRGGILTHTDYWRDDPRDRDGAQQPLSALISALSFAEPVRRGPKAAADDAAEAVNPA